tara:strand:- start:286 stop:447 length:162 start_codon:yes stop_codon:yes gene_type:complete
MQLIVLPAVRRDLGLGIETEIGYSCVLQQDAETNAVFGNILRFVTNVKLITIN